MISPGLMWRWLAPSLETLPIPRLLIRASVDRLGNHFRLRDCRWIEGCSTPGDLHRQSGEIHDAPIAAVATQIVRGPHEDAIHGARFDAECREHALAVIDREAGDAEPLSSFDTLLADVDAIDRARLGALVAGDAGRQIVAMKAAVAGGHRHWFLGILKLLSERATLWLVSDQPVPQGDPHAVSHSRYGHTDVAKPIPHEYDFQPRVSRERPKETR